MNRSKKERYSLLPYATIKAASEGNTDAIEIVLCHYRGYIKKLSTRRLYDDSGNTYLVIDETLRHRLEIKLITGILAFDAA